MGIGEGWRERMVSAEDSAYPELLRPLSDRPQRLFYKGAPPSSLPPAVAVIGTRAMTPYGRHATDCFVRDLVVGEYCIVSGLALGVDGEAHRAALACGGKTLAVLAGGLDSVQPAEHRGLAREILECGGTLLSEFPSGTPAEKHRFRRRNRIIAGLSLGVLVIEAGERSGTQITAGFAAEYGRPVFAVPGPFISAYIEGIKKLVNNGAKFVTNARDIFEELGEAGNTTYVSSAPQSTESVLQFLASVQRATMEDLIRHTKRSSSVVQQTIIELELQGKIVRDGGVVRLTA